MALIIQGLHEINELQSLIPPILHPIKIKIIDDIEDILDEYSFSIDEFILFDQIQNSDFSWTVLDFCMGDNLAFEFEEYLAYILNQKYQWITIADSYRLMSDRLRNDVHSGYYSILFEKDHSIFLVDNGAFDDEANSLDFRKLACIFPIKKQKICDEFYSFGIHLKFQYIGYQSDGIFYPIMQCKYIPLLQVNLITCWKSKHL